MLPCAPGGDLVLLAASFALAISTDLSSEDTGILAALFCAIGDNLAIIAVQKETCEEAHSS